MAIPKRCVGSQVCVLQFSKFSCAHLGSSARDLSKRPKWSTYVESKVCCAKSFCLEGLVDYSIQAEDIIIYLCAFQATRGNDAIFGDFGIMTPLDEPVVP